MSFLFVIIIYKLYKAFANSAKKIILSRSAFRLIKIVSNK